MPNAEKKPVASKESIKGKNFKRESEKEESTELKQLKRPTYAIAMFLSFVGIVIALILAFVINDALDKTETAISANFDGIISLMSDVEKSIGAVEGEIVAMNSTFADVDKSVSQLSDGISGTGSTIKGFGNTLSQISFPGFSLAQYGDNLTASGDDLIEGADELKKVGQLTEHKDKLGELDAAIKEIRDEIKKQRTKIFQTKKAISDVIGLIKLANILVFVMFMIMFGVLILNSAAGIL
jgi:methyl-accepting chemotaxis protein